jgi:arylsulfatase A-like enzyme
MSAPPNIIFLHTDQHTYDAISAYGNQWLSTPNIDRLHRNGVSFTRAYCTDPVCVPARTSWMTGRYSSETGSPFNGGSLHNDIPDLGQWLNRNGSDAFHTGKWHVEGREVTDSFKTLYHGATRIGASAGEFYDAAVTHSVVEFLSRRAGSNEPERPFFLQIGFVNPHDVCQYEHNFETKLIPDLVEQGILAESELPPLPANHLYDDNEPMIQRVVRRDDACAIHWPILRRTRTWSELLWRGLLWALYRFIEKVDAEIGVVLDALEAAGLADDTLILFAADHGEAAGQHQMFQKFTLYEESIRVPFIAACLGGPGTRVRLPKGTFDREHFVSGVDVFPTVCDYAGVPVPEGLPGLSLRPLLEAAAADTTGSSQAWRDFAFVESNYWGRAIVGERYKYITEYRPKEDEDYVPPGPGDAPLGIEQLFDLETDPGETRNLASAPQLAAVVEECRAQLAAVEKTLHRRPVLPQRGRSRGRTTVDNWRSRLVRRWEQADGTKGSERKE